MRTGIHSGEAARTAAGLVGLEVYRAAPGRRGRLLRGLGVVVKLEVDGRVVTLPDPSGGTFSAACDFDRVLNSA